MHDNGLLQLTLIYDSLNESNEGTSILHQVNKEKGACEVGVGCRQFPSIDIFHYILKNISTQEL